MKVLAVCLRDLYPSHVNKLRIYFHMNKLLTISIEMNEILYNLKLNSEAMRVNYINRWSYVLCFELLWSFMHEMCFDDVSTQLKTKICLCVVSNLLSHPFNTNSSTVNAIKLPFSDTLNIGILIWFLINFPFNSVYKFFDSSEKRTNNLHIRNRVKLVEE